VRISLRSQLIAVALVASLPWGQKALADSSKEPLIKAAFIYNFVKFVEWPPARSLNHLPGIDICVLGEDPIGGAGEVFKAASTPQFTLSLVNEPDVRKVARHCHIVFISRSRSGQMGEIMAALKGQPVLTVGDMDSFAEQGGMIGFVMSDNKIKVEVNTRAVTGAGLRVDAQLLEIAMKVIDR